MFQNWINSFFKFPNIYYPSFKIANLFKSHYLFSQQNNAKNSSFTNIIAQEKRAQIILRQYLHEQVAKTLGNSHCIKTAPLYISI